MPATDYPPPHGTTARPLPGRRGPLVPPLSGSARRYRLRFDLLLGLLTTGLVAALASVVVHPRALSAVAVMAALICMGVLIPILTLFRLHAELHYPRRQGQVGKPLPLRLSVRGGWLWPASAVLIRAGWAGAGRPGDEATFAVDRIPYRKTKECTVHVVPATRGVFPKSHPTVATSFPIGLLEVSRPIPVEGQVLVWPEVVSLQVPRDGVCTDGNGGLTHPRRVGTSGDIRGTRPYQPGEVLRRIHWQQTARHDQLIVCERSAMARRGASMLIDTHPDIHRHSPQGDTLEKALVVGASLAAALVESGLRVRLAFESTTLFEAETRRELSAVFDAMARFAPQRGVGLADLASRVEGRRRGAESQLVVTTLPGYEMLPTAETRAPHRRFVVIDPRIRPAGTGAATVSRSHGPAVFYVPLADPEHRQLRRVWEEVLRVT